MRTAWMLGGLGLVVALAANARAEPTDAVITAAEVEVRSGPSLSQEFYPTSRLYRGDHVHILRTENSGWLAISPPAGSFSWANAHDVVLHTAQTAIVNVDGCKLRVGSGLVNMPPEVERVTIPKGTALTVIDNPQTSAGETWYPVMPAPKEERYIPASAVRSEPLVEQTVAPPVAAANSELDILQARAEKADLANHFSEAIQLYQQLAAQTKDPDQHIRYLNRAQFLRDSQHNSTLVSRPSGATPAFLASSSTDHRMSAPPAYVMAQPAAFYPPQRPATSQYCYVPDPCYPVRLARPVVNAPAQSNSAPASAGPQAQWYGPGHLRRAIASTTVGLA